MHTLANISDLITNTVPNDYPCQPYSVMIGIKPSLGAKSPGLWNSLLGDKSRMFCLDVPSKANLETLFALLMNDELLLELITSAVDV